jgi:hypothetical protein
MRRNSWAVALAVGILVAAGTSGQAQVCNPPPFGVDPAYGNFSPIDWPDGSFNWVNNLVGGHLQGVWANTDFEMWFVGYINEFDLIPIAAHFDGSSVKPSRVPGDGRLFAVWGSASNDVWAVGTAGLIDHWVLWIRPPIRRALHTPGVELTYALHKPALKGPRGIGCRTTWKCHTE